MKYIYTNISKRSQFLLLPDATGMRQSNIFLVPYEHITLEYPGLHQYVPTVLRVFVEKEEIHAVDVSEPAIETTVELVVDKPQIIEPVIEPTVEVEAVSELIEPPVEEVIEKNENESKEIVETTEAIDEDEEIEETSPEGLVTKKRVGRPSKKV